MASHTLIFRREIFPASKNVSTDNLIELIKDENTEFDYFGEEIDNAFDYQDDELKVLILSSCFITFSFDTKQDISYTETDPKEFAIAFLTDKKHVIICDGKDIEVFQD